MKVIKEGMDLGQEKYLWWGNRRGLPTIRRGILYKIQLKASGVTYCFDISDPPACTATLYENQLNERCFDSYEDAVKALSFKADNQNVVTFGAGDFVYIVELGSYIKLGVTENPSNRFREYTKLPYEPKLLAMYPFIDAYEVEKELQNRFSDFRGRGEWFFMDSRLMVEALKLIWEERNENN